MTTTITKPETVNEIFEPTGFEFQDAAALEAAGKKRNGRLGRMTYRFQTADALNRNRRIYPSEVVRPAMEDFANRVERNVVFGNLDHPSEYDRDSLLVKLSDAAVKIVEATMVSDTEVQVILDILDNPDGQRLKSVIEVGGNPGISQRALASWRDAEEEERERFKIPESEFAIVAESLRLITYDVVSEPGFRDAEGAKITEHTRPGDDPMDKNELISKHPALAQELIAQGRQEAKATFEAKQDEAITAAVEAAKQSMQKDIDAATKRGDEAVAVLESVKPQLIALGIVNEQITDADAARQIATLEAANGTLKTDLAARDEKIKALEGKMAERDAEAACIEAVKFVHEQYASHPRHDFIVRQVAKAKPASTEKALEIANGLLSLLDDAGVATDAAAAPTPKSDPGPATLDALVSSLTADPAAGSRGGNGGTEANESAGLGPLLAML